MPQLALEREAAAELHRWFRQGAARRGRRGRRVHGDSVTVSGGKPLENIGFRSFSGSCNLQTGNMCFVSSNVTILVRFGINIFWDLVVCHIYTVYI